MPKKRATVLGPPEEFSKKPMYVCSSAMGLQSEKKCSSFQYPRCPTQKDKKVPFLPFGTVFSQMSGAPRFSRWVALSSVYPPVQTQSWKRRWGFLKSLRTGWDIGAFLQAFWGTIRKIGLFLGDGFGNYVAKSCLPKNLAPLADSEFDVDYDFAVKHDSIQSDDWVMDFCGIWALKISIIP